MAFNQRTLASPITFFRTHCVLDFVFDRFGLDIFYFFCMLGTTFLGLNLKSSIVIKFLFDRTIIHLHFRPNVCTNVIPPSQLMVNFDRFNANILLRYRKLTYIQNLLSCQTYHQLFETCHFL